MSAARRSTIASSRSGAARRPPDAARLRHGQPAAQRLRHRAQSLARRGVCFDRAAPGAEPRGADRRLAHELAHIKNRDTLTMAVAATIGGAISMLAQYCSSGCCSAGTATTAAARLDRRAGGHDRRAARRHARADGDQPLARIFGRPPGRHDLRAVRCGSPRRWPRSRGYAQRDTQRAGRGGIPPPRTCSSSTR